VRDEKKPAGDADVARIVNALERHLPAVFLAARGHGDSLSSEVTKMIDEAGKLLTHAEELGPKATACGILIAQTGDQASRNVSASLAGARAVTKAAVDH
jgi:hypothetical protein